MSPTTAGPPSPVLFSLTRGFAAFGLRLYRELPSGGNCFFSPLSVATALAALLPGARGETGRGLASVLGVDPGETAPASRVSELLEDLGRRTTTGQEWDPATGTPRRVERDALRLTLATGLFVEERFPLQPDYCALLEESFGADFFSVSFAEAVAAAARINGWIAAKTGGRIPSLVSPESLAPDSRLVLTNAIHFKAAWADPFKENRTRPAPFHGLTEPAAGGSAGGGGVIEVQMMRNLDTYTHWSDEGDGLAALRLPYEAGLHMLILLPAEGRFHEAEARLDLELLDRITEEAAPRLVDLRVPRFELRSRFHLSDALRRLGAGPAFEPEAADFGGITPHRDGLVLSEVLHEAWVSVDERGTEAAASTAAMVLAGQARFPPEPIPFHVDRPFLFAIQDDRTKSLLFLGRVTNPSG